MNLDPQTLTDPGTILTDTLYIAHSSIFRYKNIFGLYFSIFAEILPFALVQCRGLLEQLMSGLM